MKSLDIKMFLSTCLKNKEGSAASRSLSADELAWMEITSNFETIGVCKLNFNAVLLCISGTCDITAGHHQFQLTTHTISIVPSEYIFLLENFSSDFKAYAVLFTGDFLKKGFIKSEILEQLLHINVDYPPIFQLEESDYRDNLYKFQKINEELATNNPFRIEVVRLYLLQLLYDYNRVCEVCLLNSTTNINRQYQIVYAFRKLIDEYFGTLKTVSEYANLLHISPKYLGECTKEQLGIPAIQLIHQRIILEAELLLKYSLMSVKEIALLLNYDTASHFSRLFKTLKGITPSEYRLQQ